MINMNHINKGVPCQHLKDEERLKRNLDRNRPVAVLTKIYKGTSFFPPLASSLIIREYLLTIDNY